MILIHDIENKYNRDDGSPYYELDAWDFNRHCSHKIHARPKRFGKPIGNWKGKEWNIMVELLESGCVVACEDVEDKWIVAGTQNPNRTYIDGDCKMERTHVAQGRDRTDYLEAVSLDKREEREVKSQSGLFTF